MDQGTTAAGASVGASQEIADSCGVSANDPPVPAEIRVDGSQALAPPRYVADLIARIKESADRLANDHTGRGDLKILSRTICELRYAFKVFSAYRSTRKVAIFGSARTAPDRLAYQQAVQFGRLMAERGWLVVTGGASGIMEAGHVGAGRQKSMGLNILLPFEQSANPVIAGDRKLVHMKYFFTRKLMFVKESDAICLLPGGFGTLDEGMEVLTLLQTGKRDMVPIVMLDERGGDYWQQFQQFVTGQLLHRGLISPDDLSLYKLTDRVEDAVAEILGFFRVYHSMRYVHETLVLRFERAAFRGASGGAQHPFRRHSPLRPASRNAGPLPEGKGRAHPWPHLPRLVFHFQPPRLGAACAS